MGHWWSKKYNLPTNHPLYQSRTPASLMEEFLEDLHGRKAELQKLLENADIRDRGKIYEQIASIDSVLFDQDRAGPMVTGDTMVDDWEEMLDRGEDPDLEAGLDPSVMERFNRGNS